VTLDSELRIVQSRIDEAYNDRMDGKISEEFWERKPGDSQAEESRIRLLSSAAIVSCVT
jgi:hypothetical protein